MARLSHPNVVAAFDTGRVGEHLFVAMEFIEGTTLRRWQRAEGRKPEEIVHAYLDAARGLAAAHAAGLIHRDFKPDNVLVSDSGSIKVTDFDLVRSVGELCTGKRPIVRAMDSLRTSACEAEALETIPAPLEGSPLSAPMTEAGDMLGTPGYMFSGAVLPAKRSMPGPTSLRSASLSTSPLPREALPGNECLRACAAAKEGKTRPPPKASHVSMRVRRVLLRVIELARLGVRGLRASGSEDEARDAESWLAECRL